MVSEGAKRDRKEGYIRLQNAHPVSGGHFCRIGVHGERHLNRRPLILRHGVRRHEVVHRNITDYDCV